MRASPDTMTAAPRQRQRDPRFTRPLLTGAKRLKYDVMALGWLVAAIWFWSWWFQPEHILPGASYWIVTACLGWLFFLQGFFVTVIRKARVPDGPPPDPAITRVAMVVTKAPSEPFSMVRRTLEAMLAQDYPHDTWLADEDPQPATIAWCEAHGVRISTRKGCAAYHRAEWPRRTRCKEGNLAYFYDHYGYELYDVVSQLDADHVPQPGYLTEILRGFRDPAVGYVSAPSICRQNAGQSWAARTRLFTEAAFHGLFQAGYSGALAPMCIGSHYAVRTKALREIGGLGPELAEDHSTTMLMNAGGWRGVHALDAIAEGDGPATAADLCTQEFQWSRSLLSLLLHHTPRYLGQMPWRLRAQFLFCQLLYPLFALFMTAFYLLPIAAVIFDIRYADVTYPAFLGHMALPLLILVIIAFAIRADGFFRPRDGKVIAWEKALFMALQWPWVLWGCVMAVRDRIGGGFVDFRITPKGEAVEAQLPLRVTLPYAALALGCLIPVLLCAEVTQARGFYMLTLINGIFYSLIVATIVFRHLRDHRLRPRDLLGHLAFPPLLAALIVAAVGLRGEDGLFALAYGVAPVGIVDHHYVVAGAGMGDPGTVRFEWNLNWVSDLVSGRKE